MVQTEDNVQLRKMLDYSQEAIRFNYGKKRSDLNSDKLLALASIRCIEVLGESVNAILEKLKYRYPEIPWHQISGTRERLLRSHENVDLDVIWTIVTLDLPSLVNQLEKAVKKEIRR
jgi:uncharacterized protein with HEPN domain